MVAVLIGLNAFAWPSKIGLSVLHLRAFNAGTVDSCKRHGGQIFAQAKREPL